MSIVGTLATMNVAELFQFLEVGQKSGILRIRHENVTKMIYFERGTIVASSSNDPKEYFGQFLLHFGKIDESALKAGMEKHRELKIPLGRALVTMGIIDETEMLEMLRERALEIIYNLFLWEQADFAFEDNALFPQDLIRIEIKPASVVMEGIYRLDEWRRYREQIPSDRVILGLVPGRSIRGEAMGSQVPKILWYIKKQMTVGEICYNMHASHFHVYSQLYELITDGFIQVIDELTETGKTDSLSEYLEAPEDPIERAKECLAHEEAAEAVDILTKFLEMSPNHPEAVSLFSAAESMFVKKIYQTSIRSEAIPILAVSIDSLTTTELGPKEGFILSRINGTWDVKSILSICPFREAECLLIIQKLQNAKLIKLLNSSH